MRINEMKDSKFLKKEDLGIQGANVTIKGIASEDISLNDKPEDLKYVIYFNEFVKGMIINWTNTQLAAQFLGTEETDEWMGKMINIYEDPTITFGGKLVGGIRVRAAINYQQAQPQSIPATAPQQMQPVPQQQPIQQQQTTGAEFNDDIPF